ncbi:hypothetical protein F2Q70_00030067 [Brassica cretica]|uniref:Uncharacterized protein n=2 Tax=Brassica cretica TaxID=69181 RepID=A0A8S9H171_BRACR|nr:hypothetical protein F2Q70_00030067 [Brassica cretica]KAF2552305.1 hypothetical protein F2Q68_00034543 [Brassica cretica]KAF3486475.1 hypothetical protein F2Q69_00053332 [Brassica cretica]KAF3595474.1 hypothetical protein DY000_02022376 [Brassica cretica]
MHGFVSYRRFGRDRSLRNDQALFVLGRYIATELGLSVVRSPYSSLPVVGLDMCPFPWTIVCKLAGFLKTLEYWPRDKFWDLVSGCLILCLEMLGTSALGLGQDLGLLLLLEGAMTNSTYVSRFSFILIPYLFRVRDRCFAMLQGFSLSPAFEKHFGLTTDVRNQNCCSCLDTNNLICDRGIRTEVSRKICPWEEAFSFIVLCEVLAFRDLFRAFLRMFRIALEVWLGVKDVFTHIAKDVVGQGLDQGVIDRGPKSACRDR